MRTDTSPSRTWRASASASLCTVAARMPRRRNVRTTRTAISPRLATSTVENTSAPLHPEDAVGDRAEGGVRARRQSQAEHVARLERVDDAVVPQPRRRVVGVPLPLVLLADG